MAEAPSAKDRKRWRHKSGSGSGISCSSSSAFLAGMNNNPALPVSTSNLPHSRKCAKGVVQKGAYFL